MSDQEILHLPPLVRRPPLRLPFDGQLSRAEQRMAEQSSFDNGPVPWE